MADLQQPGMIDLLKQLANFSGIPNSVTGPTTATDQEAIGKGLDPSSPDILKQIAAQITKIKETGEMPDEQTAKTLGAAFKSHLDYNANLGLLQQLNKAYSAKYTGGKTK